MKAKERFRPKRFTWENPFKGRGRLQQCVIKRSWEMIGSEVLVAFENSALTGCFSGQLANEETPISACRSPQHVHGLVLFEAQVLRWPTKGIPSGRNPAMIRNGAHIPSCEQRALFIAKWLICVSSRPRLVIAVRQRDCGAIPSCLSIGT